MTAPTVSPPPPGSSRRDSTDRPAGPSLSPSRAADFKTCPLLFRFRTIDKLPEQPSADQVRGTLVHAVLESLFDLPAAERTPEAAAALVEPAWQRVLAEEPGAAEILNAPPRRGVSDPAALAAEADATGSPTASPASDATGSPASSLAADATGSPAGPLTSGAAAGPAAGSSASGPSGPAGASAAPIPGQAALIDVPEADEAARLARFLDSARALLPGYFAVEDPRRLEPAQRESLVSTLIDDELLIRGYIDRLDISPAGDLRVVDYKTGGAPREAFEGRALFQLKFYALVLWRTQGVVPRVLRLLYLKDAEALDYSPDAEELQRFERTLVALSAAIERAKRDQDFRPKPSRLCGWCNHQALCPEFGGTPPPFPTAPDVLQIDTTPTDDDRLA
ncbi:RecB family exonuclease [Paractinoplanes atraurantiacus]|uniref:Putative RecB family exonuclease n=1 Tax=Paractinoplanes atraurantiacus TaxID=1036182 RepID=A0A285I5H6_9ACTN|nr:PD-(D/E)XK nuclease family protein [Actinoplanes atraurantiacus]SNY42326.1 putative RecB family exonuclease [Actinoplanes atraurantiacus]